MRSSERWSGERWPSKRRTEKGGLGIRYPGKSGPREKVHPGKSGWGNSGPGKGDAKKGIGKRDYEFRGSNMAEDRKNRGLQSIRIEKDDAIRHARHTKMRSEGRRDHRLHWRIPAGTTSSAVLGRKLHLESFTSDVPLTHFTSGRHDSFDGAPALISGAQMRVGLCFWGFVSGALSPGFGPKGFGPKALPQVPTAVSFPLDGARWL